MNDYQRAVKEITNTRRADLDAGLEVWRNALRSSKALHDAYAEYQDEAIKKAQKLDNTLPQAKRKLEETAKKLGLKKEVIEPPCRCKKCGDTGYVNGKYCACVIKKVVNANGDNLALPQVDFAAASKTAPKAIAKVYGAAQKYLDGFDSDNAKPFFIVVGSSGTGKTMLAAAVATEAIARGKSAVTVSAFEFLKRAKDYHTQFAIADYRDTFSPMLDCELLVIDDLGTETMLKNITSEYLYTVVNERWLRKKHTLVTTNLTPEALISRYGEAIFSRLCDKSRANLFLITAPNARLQADKK
ncbi:MAG: ATP-binding protein [Clostridiales bacterium]|nr:ATP-binding protein [Clostridiales bacterium]